MDPLNMPIMKVCQETMASEITLPGFGFNDTDAEKRISFFAMAKMGECSQILTNYYSPAAVPFGKLQGHATQAVLYSVVVTFVRVDEVTRRPIPIPDKFVRTVGRKLGTCHVPQMNTMYVPKVCLKVDFIANWGDCDLNRHVNQTSYLKFCQSAAEQLKWSEMLPGCHSSSVRTIQAIHSGETFPGQKLTASVWKEGPKLCFHLFNENAKKTVYQAAFNTLRTSHL
ncbi:hypothetical protein CAPTEDRAFT_189764 [Capitella teleta]|uniref:Acyl-ACP thioesterase n=1 Tax=Capitella teleta TaxID=283909 RepID=R7UG90_CAPTE|nr:hypothetical protein CAPTEDRAFT_189764 [Capitella teleta]|eukprot:ELU05083.1 hypothetical protein CAPTEDRAFT_189764 [Capitella teleta]